MVAARTAAVPSVPRHALTEVQQDRTRRIGRPQAFVVGKNLLRRNRWAIPFAIAKGLGVVWLIPMHPTDNGGIIEMAKADFVLATDQADSGLLQCRKLLFRGSL